MKKPHNVVEKPSFNSSSGRSKPELESKSNPFGNYNLEYFDMQYRLKKKQEHIDKLRIMEVSLPAFNTKAKRKTWALGKWLSNIHNFYAYFIYGRITVDWIINNLVCWWVRKSPELSLGTREGEFQSHFAPHEAEKTTMEFRATQIEPILPIKINSYSWNSYAKC